MILLAGCGTAPGPHPSATPSFNPSPTPSPTSRPTAVFIPTATSTPKPLTLLFYGDSVLKVGDVSHEGEVGFSIVDDLRQKLDPADTVIVQNHGGRSAQWGFENLQKNVLDLHPDLVTLWWGVNDLGGCPGIFDPTTDRLVQYKLTAYVDQHIKYMRAQIDALLAAKVPVIVITSIPVDGTFPWSHMTSDNQLVWELDRRCDFNLGLGQLAEAQRKMVTDYSASGKPVSLVDAWQIYHDHAGTDKMYMDIVHPASQGAQLIAEGWLKVFQSIER